MLQKSGFRRERLRASFEHIMFEIPTRYQSRDVKQAVGYEWEVQESSPGWRQNFESHHVNGTQRAYFKDQSLGQLNMKR